MIEQLIADSDLKYWAREAGLSVMAAIYKRKSRVLTVSEFSEVSAVPLFNRDINIRNSRLFLTLRFFFSDCSVSRIRGPNLAYSRICGKKI